MDSLNSKIRRSINKIKNILSILFFRLIKIKKFNDFDNGYHQNGLDRKLVYSLSKSKIPNLKQIKYIKKFLNPRELWLIRASLFFLILSSVFLGFRLYQKHLKIMPIAGGEYIEGLVGYPQYINPLYSYFSDVDSDISNLVFSSFFKRDKDGHLVNDLAESYEISEDNKIYTIKIRPDAKWHNGSALAVNDIMFTFNTIKDIKYNSPLRSSFIGAEIEKVDNSTIKFILTEPYAAFLELLTFSIIPEELWYKIPPKSFGLAELNLKPVGSGPYKFKSLTKDKTGLIKDYHLIANEDYYGIKPKITNLSFYFFNNFEEAINALNANNIEGISYLPKYLESNLVLPMSFNIHKLNQPQLNAIFFNQKNNKFLADIKIRRALSLTINKNEIINNVLKEGAGLISGPILPNNFAYNKNNKDYFNRDEAIKLLDESGWKVKEITAEDIKQAEIDMASADEKVANRAKQILSLGIGQWRVKDDAFLVIRITAVDSEENIKVAEAIKNYWENLNIKVNLEQAAAIQIQADIIKSRNFEVLLYSQIVGDDPDTYAYWHSSQAGANGLNLSDYANNEVDKLLEDARLTADISKRKEYYKKFQEIISEDIPAIFLYSPRYNYIQSKKIKNFNMENILVPSDRFNDVFSWYIKTGKKLVWD